MAFSAFSDNIIDFLCIPILVSEAFEHLPSLLYVDVRATRTSRFKEKVMEHI